jgi:glycosyltransferase involved in cell wall biosynthesis
MRVIIYSHTAFFETSLSLAEALAPRAEVHLITEVGPGAWRTAYFDVPPLPVKAGLRSADSLLEPYFPPAVRARWQRLASYHLAVHEARRSVSLAAWRVSREVLGSISDLSPDILHIDGVDVSLRIALALPGWSGPPIVMSSHDPTPHSGETGWRKRLAKRLAYRRASTFVVHSAAMRESFAPGDRVPLDRVRVVRLGVLSIARAWAAGPETGSGSGAGAGPANKATIAPTVLFFGRLSPYKGLEVLYAAIPIVAAAVPGVRFVVAGRPIPGYEPPPAPRADGGGRVDVIQDHISNERLAALLEESTVVACPYLDATQSGVVLTAFAFGRPVVASDVGGLGEYVLPERTGLLVPPGDPAALAAALIRILVDAPLRGRLAAGIAEDAIGRLSWHRAADQMLAVYDEVVRGPS